MFFSLLLLKFSSPPIRPFEKPSPLKPVSRSQLFLRSSFFSEPRNSNTGNVVAPVSRSWRRRLLRPLQRYSPGNPSPANRPTAFHATLDVCLASLACQRSTLRDIRINSRGDFSRCFVSRGKKGRNKFN